MKPETRRLLSFGLPKLDSSLRGGIPLGKLAEWGLPPGKQGRSLLLKLLTHEKPLALWVYGGEDTLAIYPPAWQARGVDLRRTYFARSQAPVREMRPVFLEPLFELVVLDMPRLCTQEEQAFLARQAKALGFGIFLLQPYFLSHAQGNPFAPYRFNSWFAHEERQFYLEAIRGFPPVRLAIAAEAEEGLYASF